MNRDRTEEIDRSNATSSLAAPPLLAEPPRPSTPGTASGPSPAPPAGAGLDWPRCMRALGLWVRRLRELSGLSQERLAELAGVSQGAVSRLEAGRQLATPMVVVARIGFVLLAAARERDSHLLDEGLGHLHGLLRGLAAGNPGFRLDRPSLADPRLRELGDIYRGASESQRRAILAAARALSGKGGADSIT